MGSASERTAEEIARGQLGLITRRQATEAGLREHRIDQRLHCRSWLLVHPGVYALAGSPPSWRRDVLAATLAGNPDAAGSHLTAIAVHGFADGSRTDVEITVGDTTTRLLRRVVVHRSLVLAPQDRVVVDGIPVTSVARTLADCSGRLSLGQLARALDDALVRDLVRRADLVDVCSRLLTRAGWTVLYFTSRDTDSDIVDSIRPFVD